MIKREIMEILIILLIITVYLPVLPGYASLQDKLVHVNDRIKNSAAAKIINNNVKITLKKNDVENFYNALKDGNSNVHKAALILLKNSRDNRGNSALNIAVYNKKSILPCL